MRWIGYGAVAWLLVSCACQAQEGTVVQTRMESKAAAPGAGSRYRKDVDKAMKLAMSDRPDEAIPLLGPALDYCAQQQARGNISVVSVENAAEYETYLAERTTQGPVEWLDIACASAPYVMGYVLAGKGEYAQALPWLERAAALAPYYPEPVNERGFALVRLGRLEEALASYRQAEQLGRRFPAARHILPVSLRGAGYALIEQQRWEEAKAAFDRSLELDPGNAIALQELEYIRNQRGDLTRTAADEAAAP